MAASPNELVRALEGNLWSFGRNLGSGPGGRVVDTETRLVVHTPVPNPPYNGIWRFGDEGGASLLEQADRILDGFRERGVPAIWFIHPTAPSGLENALEGAGLELADELSGMARSLEDLEPLPMHPDGIEVRETTIADTDTWLELIWWRYGLDRAASSPYLTSIFRRAIGDGTIRLWIAYLDGEPVSKAAIHCHRGVAGVYGVATTEAGRGRGLASLLTLHGLHAARDDGVSTSVLHATPMARALYERLRYRTVAPFRVLADPGTPHF
ncbi:MAG: GNAT family N-acetyltransferase [Myxococcota bacterium]